MIEPPTIIIDTREQRPLTITAYPTVRDTLPIGDYGIKGFSDWENPGFILERKSLSDLCGSLGKERPRFLREIEKMRQFRFRGLLIEAVKDEVELAQYRSAINPLSILRTLDALSVRAGVHVYWCRDAEGAARQTEGLVSMFIKGIIKDYNRLSRGK